jgi:hypothetical protein
MHPLAPHIQMHLFLLLLLLLSGFFQVRPASSATCRCQALTMHLLAQHIELNTSAAAAAPAAAAFWCFSGTALPASSATCHCQALTMHLLAPRHPNQQQQMMSRATVAAQPRSRRRQQQQQQQQQRVRARMWMHWTG